MKEGGFLLVWVVWTLLAVVAAAAIIAGTILWMFRRWHRVFPKPVFKQPQSKPDIRQFEQDQVTVCWVGHSTVFISFFGVGILTDPVFSRRVGLHLIRLFTVGVKRHTAPALTLADLAGHVDVILLSHAHMDHFDLPSLRKLQRSNIEVVTASGTGKLLRGLKCARIHELGGRDAISLACGVEVRAVPVRHWGNRFPWNKGYGFTGYLLSYQGKQLFFAGDTAYTPTFMELRERGPIDLVLMPIGAYSPDVFQGNHCTPEQAWQMFKDTGATWLAPIHWDTFVLSQEPVAEPLQRLTACADDASRIVWKKHGEVFTLPRA